MISRLPTDPPHCPICGDIYLPRRGYASLALLGAGKATDTAAGGGGGGTGPPIAYDSFASGGRNLSTTSVTLSHTCTGSDRILLVGVHTETSVDQISGVTYAGVAMTRVGTVLTTGSERDYLYILVAPATGANNIVVSASSTAIISCSSVSYTGARQSSQPDASGTNTATTTAFTVSVTTTVNQCWLVGTFSSSGTVSAVLPAVRRANLASTYATMFDSNGMVLTAGSDSIQTSGSSGIWGGVVAAIAPVNTAWSPADITGMKSWLRGDTQVWNDAGVTLATNGQSVRRWGDQSGLNNYVASETAGFRPLYRTANGPNGKPWVEGDGVDDWMNASYVLAQPVTLLMVMKWVTTPGAGNGRVASGFNSNVTGEVFTGLSVNGDLSIYAGTSLALAGGALTTGTWYGFAGVFNNTSSRTRTVTRTETVGAAGTAGPAGLTLFSNGISAQPSPSGIAEVIQYGAALSTADVAAIFSYWRGKYGGLS